jgi:hypothetical protein
MYRGFAASLALVMAVPASACGGRVSGTSESTGSIQGTAGSASSSGVSGGAGTTGTVSGATSGSVSISISGTSSSTVSAGEASGSTIGSGATTGTVGSALVNGSVCSGDSQCQSQNCVSTDDINFVCASACNGEMCSSGFSCQGGFCFAAGGSSTGASSGSTAPLSWTDVYNNVGIGCICLPCHAPPTGGGYVNGRLDLSSPDTAYMNLVGVRAAGAACDTSGLTRVVAGSAAQSLLYDKLDSKTTAVAAPCGSPEPEGSESALSAADMAMIETWINEGANP